MPQFHFTGSFELDSLYMTLNYSHTGIHGCISGSQEYCIFSKEKKHFSLFFLSVSFLRGLFLFVCFWSKSFSYFLWNINILNNNPDNFPTLVHFQRELEKIKRKADNCIHNITQVELRVFPRRQKKEQSPGHWGDFLWPALQFCSRVEAVRMLWRTVLKCVLT